MQNSHSFRPDINGLRAIAVVSVLLYHFKVPGFAGGFVGVDVFLVISGFLMTQILVLGLERGDFKAQPLRATLDFYRRRALRIIPALTVLAVVVVVAGWFLLLPDDYMYLGSEVAFALLFLSNYKYYFSPEGNVAGDAVGYFADTEQVRWLLHSWSLSLEWQFYIVYPLLLWGVWRIARQQSTFVLIFAFVTVASFLINLAFCGYNPELTFYSLPTRGWEFISGGLAFLLGRMYAIRRAAKPLLFYSGLILICISVLFSFDTASWPGLGATVPVLGTALVISAQRNNAWVLYNPLAQGLGLISYSLYLWHWPVIMTLQYFYVPQTILVTVAGLTTAVLLAAISYWLVERRALSASGGPPVFAWALVGALIALPVGAGAIVRFDGGMPERLSSKIVASLRERSNFNPRRAGCHLIGVTQAPECRYGGEHLGVILTGDSHAGSIARTLEASLPLRSQYVLDMTIMGCPTVIGANRKGLEYQCSQFTEYVRRRLHELPEGVPLVIASRASFYTFGPNEGERGWHGVGNLIWFEGDHSGRSLQDIYRDRQLSTLCEFAERRPVFLLQPIPEMKRSVPKFVARRMIAGLSHDISISTEEYTKRHRFVLDVQRQAAATCGIKLLNPTQYLCSGGRCSGTRDGLPLYLDDDHLSERGARLLLPLFSAIHAAGHTIFIPKSLSETE